MKKLPMTTRRRPPKEVSDLHDKAFRNGIHITEALKKAGTSGSTWSRWRQGHNTPSSALLAFIDTALDELIAESEYDAD